MKYRLIYFSLFSICLQQQIQAEAVFDGSLGAKAELSGNFKITADKGQQQGNNLFHSFSKFNINQGESATFSGPDNIQYVINRVTGGDLSNINGALRSTFPKADIYLINPAGVMFGEEASLDIQGSLVVSTANTLHLKDEGEFHANDPQNSILTSAPPSAFGFLTDTPASISMQNSELEIADGETLSLIGGEINIQESVLLNSGMTIVGLASSGEVSVNGETNLKNVSHLANVTIDYSDITMSGDTTHGIYIRGGQFMVDDSSFRADVSGDQEGGNIVIEADNVEFIGDHGKARILSGTFGKGKGGNVLITAKEDIVFEGNSSIFADSGCGNSECKVDRVGDAGSIILKANQVLLLNGAQLVTATTQAGAGGNVEITADDSIVFSGEGVNEFGEYNASGILSYTVSESDNAGSAGSVILQAKNFIMEGGTRIVGNTLGAGQGGSVLVKVDESMTLSDSSLISADSEYLGDAGEILIEAGNLKVSGGSAIASGTFGFGNGGLVTLKVAGTTEVSGRTLDDYPSGIFAESGSEALGNAGVIVIETNRLIVNDGAVIDGSTFGEGQGGGMIIIAKDSVQIKSTDEHTSLLAASSDSDSDWSGDAGQIELQTNNLMVKKGGRIATSTFGGGQAGDVIIQANQISLQEKEAISSASRGFGSAGNIILDVEDLRLSGATISTAAELAEGGSITIQAKELVDLAKSKITTSVKGESGDGGNIHISQPNFVVLGSSEIIAQAVGGNGGNIKIVAENFVATPDSVVDASSERGIDGEVNIDSPDSETVGGVIVLPATFLNVSAMIKESCAAAVARGKSSSFVVVGRSGLPISAEAFQPSSLPKNLHRLKTSARAFNPITDKHTAQLPVLLIGCAGKL